MDTDLEAESDTDSEDSINGQFHLQASLISSLSNRYEPKRCILTPKFTFLNQPNPQESR